MPKRKDLKTILVVGAGPIIIGQACEFDYSGTQACKALKDEGYKVILINSNPANSNPGLTVHPTSVYSPVLCAACQYPASTNNCGNCPAAKSGPKTASWAGPSRVAARRKISGEPE